MTFINVKIYELKINLYNCVSSNFLLLSYHLLILFLSLSYLFTIPFSILSIDIIFDMHNM